MDIIIELEKLKVRTRFNKLYCNAYYVSQFSRF